MNTAVKITAFGAALAASFTAAYGVGGAVGPATDGAEPATHSTHAEAAPGDREDGEPAAGGLQVSEAGYTLDLDTPTVRAGRSSELRFAVRDRSGKRLTAYQREHAKELHLIVASRDLATYRHLHPVRAADGTWSTPVDLPAAGAYRVFADFTPAAKGAGNLTLGADLAASGAYRPAEPPEPSRTTTVDGYTVTLDGDLRPGRPGALSFEVRRNGRPVPDLQPYLGAYGHLVALRSGDMAYLHVHPDGEPGDGRTAPGPVVSFGATAPSSGTYRLFLDFRHHGTVRTAAFTVRAGTTDGVTRPAEETAPSESTEGHRH